jgi:uncharacterized membrane protein
MSKKEIKEDAMKNEDSKGFAFLGIFLTVIGFVIVLLTHKKDKYAMYYAKQGLIIFFGFLVAGAVSAILGWIPIVGWIVSTASWIFMMVLWVMGLIYSLSGEEKEIWLVGELAKKINV